MTKILLICIFLHTLCNAQNFRISTGKFEAEGSCLTIHYSVQNLTASSQHFILNPHGFETYFDNKVYTYDTSNINEMTKNLFAPRIVVYKDEKPVGVDFFSMESPIDSIEIARLNQQNELLKKRKEHFLPLKKKLNKPYGWLEVYEAVNSNIMTFKPNEIKHFSGSVDLDKFIYDDISRYTETFNLKDNTYYDFSLKLHQDKDFLKEFMEDDRIRLENIDIESKRTPFLYRTSRRLNR